MVDNVLNLFDVWTLFVSIIYENFNRFKLQLSKELSPKRKMKKKQVRKNAYKLKSCWPIFEISQPHLRKYVVWIVLKLRDSTLKITILDKFQDFKVL